MSIFGETAWYACKEQILAKIDLEIKILEKDPKNKNELIIWLKCRQMISDMDY